MAPQLSVRCSSASHESSSDSEIVCGEHLFCHFSSGTSVLHTSNLCLLGDGPSLGVKGGEAKLYVSGRDTLNLYSFQLRQAVIFNNS
jgi:hypothetical protein